MRNQIKGFIIGVIFTTIIALCVPSVAQVLYQNVKVIVGSCSISVNGQNVAVDSIGYNGKNYLAVRDIGNVFDKSIDWDGDSRTVIINDKYIEPSPSPVPTPSPTVLNKSENVYYIVDIENGSYEGGAKDDAFNGIGKYTWDSKDVYIGEFINGKRTGKGVYFFPNGDVYVGDFKGGVLDGNGCYIYENGNVEKGNYVNNKLKGGSPTPTPTPSPASERLKDQTITYNDGTKYKGETVSSLPDGFGLVTFSNGDSYMGYFYQGELHGYGSYSYKNGDFYTGYFYNGKKDGYGTYYFKNGDYYQGVWKADKSDVIGIKSGSTGKYVGEFNDDTASGEGIFISSSNGAKGYIYNGVFQCVITQSQIPITEPASIDTYINGEFTGFSNGNIFRLLNGQIWKQTSYDYYYTYKYSPKVLIYKDDTVYKMKVDGVEKTVTVKRIN